MMIILVKLIIGIFTTMTINSINSYEPIQEQNELTAVYTLNYKVKDAETKDVYSH